VTASPGRHCRNDDLPRKVISEMSIIDQVAVRHSDSSDSWTMLPPVDPSAAISDRSRFQAYNIAGGCDGAPGHEMKKVNRRPLPERCRTKWKPVRVKKTRPNNKLEPGSDSIRT
jgi:hypothetical protein